MFNLFRKIPKGYVETVDGYLIKRSETKEVLEDGKATYYRKEKAPAYDKVTNYLSWGVICKNFYKNNVEVKEDGTPFGYHTPEELQKLKDRIKELEDKYEPKLITVNGTCGAGATLELHEQVIERMKRLNNVGKPSKTKRKNGKRRSKKNPNASVRPKKTLLEPAPKKRERKLGSKNKPKDPMARYNNLNFTGF